MQTLEEEISDIRRYYGEGWPEEVLNSRPEIGELPASQRPQKIRECGIHGQTSFFREGLVLGAIRHVVIPSYAGRIAIASVGCSDGREAYSLLMSNWEARSRLRLTGYDVNPQHIAEAREGQYRLGANDRYKFSQNCSEEATANAYDDLSGERWKDFRIRFSDETRRHASFEVWDILKAPLPKQHDIIVLSYVLPHYTQAGRERILEHIRRSMPSGGWLVCEPDQSHMSWTREYCRWMRDISHLGLHKQRMIFPWWFEKDSDNTGATQVYRKE